MSAELLRAVSAALVSAALVSAAWGLPSGVPVEAPGGGLAPEDVSPGVIGFLVTLALVLACVPLFRSMTGKLRGVQHRDPAGEADDAGPGLEPRSGTGAGTGPGSDAG
jgi:hypothetical protein